MKTKAITLFLVLIMAVSFCCGGSGTVLAADYPTSGKCGENIDWMINTSTGVLNISGSGEMTSAPWQIKSGSTYWYGKYGGSLKAIHFYGDITSICDAAFRNSAVESVTIPDSVTTIGKEAFLNCKSLTSLTLGNHVTNIDDAAFGDCVKLGSIAIPDSVERIGRWAFSGCLASDVTFGSQTRLKTIDKEGFGECSFVSFTLPATVETLGEGAFTKCPRLTTFSFGGNTHIKEIPASLFSQDTALRSVAIPDTVESIGNYAFYACPMTSVAFSDSVEFIGQYAFSQSGLSSVTFGSGLQSIGKYAFHGTKLTAVTIPDSVKSVGTCAFYDNGSLRTVTFGKQSRVTEIRGVFLKCPVLTSVTFGDNLVTLGENTFKDCPQLRTVELGSSLRTIEKNAFLGCTSLKGLTLPDTITTVSDSMSDKPQLEYFTMSVDAGLSTVEPGFWQGCAKLTSLVIPNNVTNVGSFACADCTSLRDVTIGRNVAEIGGSAFINCPALTNVHYMGSQADWDALRVHIADGNNPLLAAHITFAESSPDPNESPVSLSVRKLPDKTVYYVGDTLDTTGMNLTLHYANGATKQTSTGFTCTPTAFTQAGRQNVTVIYENLTTTFPVTVAQPPAIISQPYDVVGQNGDKATFRVKATGEGLSYQWQAGRYAGDEGDYWTNLPSLTDTCTTDFHYETYRPISIRCVVTDQYGRSVITRTAHMYQSLSITAQPTQSSANFGDPLTFECGTNVFGEFSYQWQFSDNKQTWYNAVEGNTSLKNLSDQLIRSVFTVTLTEQNVGRYVRCVISDNSGTTLTSKTVYMKASAPVITQQPVSVTGLDGDTVTFKVKASGGSLTYQWQISDDQGKTWRSASCTDADYTTTLTRGNSGRYVRCVVKDGDTSVKSNAAYMKVSSLTISSQPVTVKATEGELVTFQIGASGPGIAYQWQLSDDQGKTWRNSSIKTATYSTILSDKNNGRGVRCVVTDKYGNALTSDAAYMKKTAAKLSITSQPASVTALNGDLVTFKVKATGDKLTYQWQLSDDKGATWRNSANRTDTYCTTLADYNNTRYVRCIVTDKYGIFVKSNAAYMKISSLKITSQPVSVTAKAGDQASFQVTAQGPGTLTYQWQLSDDGKTWRNSSVKTASYATTLTEKNDGRSLRCLVTDKYGNTVTSKAVTMKSK